MWQRLAMMCIYGLIIVIMPIHAGHNGELRLLFAGDIMAHDVNISQRDHNQIYERIRPFLQEHHLNFANFESVLSDKIRPQGYPRFSVGSRYAQAAIEAGFNVFSLANNHSADHYRAGILQSLESWQLLRQRYPWVRYAGLRSHPQERWPMEVIHVQGWRVGFIAVTQFLNWQETQQDIGSELVDVINFRNAVVAQSFLRYVQEVRSSVDLLIVSYHGGDEYVLQDEPQKLAFYRRLVDAGADIVWGHHPHVLQPYHWYRDRLIIQSAGNLISGQTWAIKSNDYALDRAYTGDTLLYSVALSAKASDEPLEMRLVQTIPVSSYRHPQHGMILIHLEDLDWLPEAWQRFYHYRYKAMQKFQ
ncbi:CapA family protein (plasmid) [Entomospira entomophila]|uniref:CapA family protein n=1 Tax=Entomospira entomophila TaxID=2719988 RepID=A0A968KUH8_9SPIO|nr:CapA family protein [Entomospira entomophilus]NIZ41491.1 CapA family protein [Entomospira entomophilus]WDI36325.1 CapA family protein [Entomospira entomophilus]